MEPNLNHDSSSVYHDGESVERLLAEVAAGYAVPEEQQFNLTRPPRPFALVLDDTPAEERLTDADELPVDEIVVGWGYDLGHEVIVYLRDPFTGRRQFGVFGSAESARAVLGRRRGTLATRYL